MNSMHLSDDEHVHVHGAPPSYSVRAEIIDMTGKRHQGFLSVSPSELAGLDINRPETWPGGTRAVAEGSLFSLVIPGAMRRWQRIGEDPARRPASPRASTEGQRHPHGSTEGRHPRDGHRHPHEGQRPRPPTPARGERHPHAPKGQRWVAGRWDGGANGRMVWVAGHYEPEPPAPRHAPPPAPRQQVARPDARSRPVPPPVALPPAPPVQSQPVAPPAPSPAPATVYIAPWAPAQPSAHRDFDRSYTLSIDPGWGERVHAVYEDGSIALHDGRTFEARDVEHYHGDGLIILRDGQQLAPPEGAQPVHSGSVTTWAAPVGVPGPQSASHNGVTFAGLPPGTIFFDEDHSFGYQTAQGEVVTGYWNPNGTYRIDDPELENIREAAAQGAAEGVANAFKSMGGSDTGDDDLLSFLEV